MITRNAILMTTLSKYMHDKGLFGGYKPDVDEHGKTIVNDNNRAFLLYNQYYTAGGIRVLLEIESFLLDVDYLN